MADVEQSAEVKGQSSSKKLDTADVMWGSSGPTQSDAAARGTDDDNSKRVRGHSSDNAAGADSITESRIRHAAASEQYADSEAEGNRSGKERGGGYSDFEAFISSSTSGIRDPAMSVTAGTSGLSPAKKPLRGPEAVRVKSELPERYARSHERTTSRVRPQGAHMYNRDGGHAGTGDDWHQPLRPQHHLDDAQHTYLNLEEVPWSQPYA
ncbi:hypothetical protein JKP88DRAFT_245358 [Tribonema minus]|uniref:Uncharacterized protein n=1 Tax=Tribonema minus TaxID=303371 RepID=A0A836CEF6_9STRA|nr:hypothetical protein JKP88DRAFT_245358 [Tribonema minus]